MANNHIANIKISGLRGISQPLEINLQKPLTLVYGENGTGKTSICDAVDFLGNGEVGSLADISTGGQKHKYWPFLGSNIEDINVSVQLKDGQNWVATAAGRVVSVTNSASRPIVKIWRRKQLIDLILAKPADRFSVIKPFINLSEIENSESQIRELKRDIDRAFDDNAKRIAENLDLLCNMQELSSDKLINEVEWARGQLEVPVEDVDDEIDILETIVVQLDTLNDLLVKQSIQKGISENTIEHETKEKDAYDRIKIKFDENVEETIDVLTAAQHYFNGHENVDECPLCMSKENAKDLDVEINKKLDVFEGVRQAKSNLVKATKDKDIALGRYNESYQESLELFRNLMEEIDQLEPYPKMYELVSEVLDKKEINDLDSDKILEVIGVLSSSKDSLLESKGTRSALQSALDAYDLNMSRQEKITCNRPVVVRLLELHEVKRKKYVDNILASIAGEVGRLYEEIHPGEGLNKIALQLDPRRRSSLEIESQFLNQPVTPGAYLSNSHLDSLGLCILIAIAKLEDLENTVLVMDDILGSIDEPHVDRIIGLLYAESSNFLHTLVTTHYQAWHFKIRRGQLRNANCQLVELKKWSAATGVTVRDEGRSLLKILEQCVQEYPNEPEPIASHAGHLLEQLGDFIVSRYACSVPKRVTGNTLNDYLDALKPKFTQHLKVCIKQEGDTPEDVSYIEVQLLPMFEELKEIYQVRNTTGAHYNDMANHMPVADILRFGKLVVELCNALICPDNGLPNKQKQGAYWATTGETRQLHPLVKP